LEQPIPYPLSVSPFPVQDMVFSSPRVLSRKFSLPRCRRLLSSTLSLGVETSQEKSFFGPPGKNRYDIAGLPPIFPLSTEPFGFDTLILDDAFPVYEFPLVQSGMPL